MKKVLAIALALTLILSISASAFAGRSPSGGGDSSSVPVEVIEAPAVVPVVNTTDTKTTEVIKAPVRSVTVEGAAPVELTPEQEEQIDAALEDATKSGNAVVEAVYVAVPEDVSESNPAAVVIELAENEVILLYGLDGRLLKTLTAKDLVSKDGGVEVNLTESCILVIAKK